MKFPALETKDLNDLCSRVINEIKDMEVSGSEKSDLTFGDGSFLDDCSENCPRSS
jgi:hypothetical protein